MSIAIERLKKLVANFKREEAIYIRASSRYNEESCRIEFIDKFFTAFGWDVGNEAGLSANTKEVVVEKTVENGKIPDYTFTLKGVSKFFVEAKKPSVDILNNKETAFQARKYGWNAKHGFVVLTNFRDLVIFDTTIPPVPGQDARVARIAAFHYDEFVEKSDQISGYISKDAVYSGAFDDMIRKLAKNPRPNKISVDEHFLKKINDWRLMLSQRLYKSQKTYSDLQSLSLVVQRFINRMVFVRICEDRQLPLYENLTQTIASRMKLKHKLTKLFKECDKRYNSGLFSDKDLVLDLDDEIIAGMVEDLYFPKSIYDFSIIGPYILGQIYELFLTQKLRAVNGNLELATKDEYEDRSVVSTPQEIVRYMVSLSMGELCENLSPEQLMKLRIADISCGSGIFLQEAFQFVVDCATRWYEQNVPTHLEEGPHGEKRLPFNDRKKILTSCFFGVDIDESAVSCARFSLLLKLLEGESCDSIREYKPALPDLMANIQHGNSLVEAISGRLPIDVRAQIMPFKWNQINGGKKFDVILGNPPYVATEDLHRLVHAREFSYYKKHYSSAYKQFDKYYLFIERGLNLLAPNGSLCLIVQNKFTKVGSGVKLSKLLAENGVVKRLDNLHDEQLFGSDKTTYSAILHCKNHRQEKFIYSEDVAARLLAGENVVAVEYDESMLSIHPWRLTVNARLRDIMARLDVVGAPLSQYAEIFNGIQTSAERPDPIYWFDEGEILSASEQEICIHKFGHNFKIEKAILKPYFKPTDVDEKGSNSYTHIETKKRIIFPYDEQGKLIPETSMKRLFPGAYAYLCFNYKRLCPRTLSADGEGRDVPGATANTWYQYGRTQSLTSFIDTPKLIVGVLSRDPMFVYDDKDLFIASGGTAGYCAIAQKDGSPYSLEYIQAWMSHPLTEELLKISASDFEGGFHARGTMVLKKVPFIAIDLGIPRWKRLHDDVVNKSRKVYVLSEQLASCLSSRQKTLLSREKDNLIKQIQDDIAVVYDSVLD